MNFHAAIFNKLAAASPVTSLLGSFNGAPAIFTAVPVPRATARPYLSITRVSETPFDALDAERNEAIYDVTVIANYTGSEVLIESLALAVRQALHRQKLTIPGGSHISTWCLSVGVAPTDDSLVGRVLTFQIRAS